MKRQPPPLNFIRSFECAARHLSFTRAARELGYTQAAISTHIRALEDHVGRALFIRHPRSLELTEIGRAFLPSLGQALDEIDRATEAVVTSSRAGSVVLACPMSLAENWLPAALAGFRAENPEVEVLVQGTLWEPGGDGLADVVITLRRDDAAPHGAERLWPEELVLLCAPGMAAGLTGPGDLGGAPRIVISGRQEFWTLMERALDLPEGTGPSPLRANGWNVALELAAAGLGATVALGSLSATHLARGLLVEPFGQRLRSPWSYYVATPETGRPAVAARLRAYLLDVARPGRP
ncbi:DNA-binding transcriptional regulator, LysR family [Rhodovulum sp. ES.010]|uniref:LysR substrate-binding domain-containing protein n=1 Tax=Rhodovulum sp. ES.010 TaxID=1882821 RepID=UPI000926FE52|nr:LysR substrate-binding domain-containing protein [Rhodovulum sp. ES.010]SIO33375.1 DNA-binding transcriptional regulator, LysR family [Rhodovulum sp. ES.010]